MFLVLREHCFAEQNAHKVCRTLQAYSHKKIYLQQKSRLVRQFVTAFIKPNHFNNSKNYFNFWKRGANKRQATLFVFLQKRAKVPFATKPAVFLKIRSIFLRLVFAIRDCGCSWEHCFAKQNAHGVCRTLRVCSHKNVYT